METKNIIDEIKNQYSNLKSLTVIDNEEYITLKGARYRYGNNHATSAQIDYVENLDNVDYQSTSNLMKGNKWFMSACISIAKRYENVEFYVVID